MMNRVKILIAAIALCMIAGITSALACQTWVDGYYRANGTYVQGHWRSCPDGNPYNNLDPDWN